MSTIVYRYGLHAPHEGAEVVHAQIRAAHRYRNALVEIERGRRAAVRAVELEAGDLAGALRELDRAKSEAKKAYEIVKRWRAKERSRKEPAEMRAALTASRVAEHAAVAQVRELRAALKSCCAACKEARAADPCPHASERAVTLRRAVDAIGERAKELGKSAYQHSGVYWGQRALVDEAAGDSFGDLGLYDTSGQPNDPSFARWTGDGAVGLQIIGGLSVVELQACADTRLRLRAPDPRAWQGEGRAGRARCADRRRYGSTAELALRVGTVEGSREPVFARWACDMDRPLPAGARVVYATAHVRQRGPHSEWSLSLTVQVPDGPYAREGEQPPRKGGAVAVDIGWRVEGDSLRVAAWRDELGGSGVLRLDAATLALLRSPQALASEKETRFAGARLGLAWWAASGAKMPLELRAEIAEMPRWKAPSRLVALWQHWRGHRFAGDERAFGLLMAWYEHDRALWSAEALNRTQSLRRRREVYRVFAAMLARDYATIVIEQFDLRVVARREALAADRENETARSNRQLAALSELVTSIEHAARARDRLCAAVPAADTTRTCPSCGLVADRDAAASIVLACECGHSWDQDRDGAALLLLARWRERPGDAKIAVSTRAWRIANDDGKIRETRWQRVARLRKDKEARMGAAREEGGKDAE